MSDDATSYGFLCGADMEPGKIRRNPVTSESRFVDIGSVPAAVAGLHLPLPDVGEIWGVVVTLSHRASNEPQEPQASVTLRLSGTVVQASVLSDAISFGAPSEALAEAYYWELPRGWREALAGQSSR